MITTENINLRLELPTDCKKIEAALIEQGITPLRWAITKVNDEILTVNVSFEK